MAANHQKVSILYTKSLLLWGFQEGLTPGVREPTEKEKARCADTSCHLPEVWLIRWLYCSRTQNVNDLQRLAKRAGVAAVYLWNVIKICRQLIYLRSIPD